MIKKFLKLIVAVRINLKLKKKLGIFYVFRVRKEKLDMKSEKSRNFCKNLGRIGKNSAQIFNFNFQFNFNLTFIFEI